MTTPPICDYEDSDYQQVFWDAGERAYEDQVEAVALHHLLPKEGGKRLLELGAGTGRNTPRYSGYQQVVLVDYSATQLSQAVERLGVSQRYRYFAADVAHLPFAPSSFDAATMIRTLHHIVDVPAVLQEVEGVLNGGAAFILEYANKRNLKAILRYVLHRQEWNPFAHETVEFVKLNFNFHPRKVREWLEQAGFAIERQRTVSHFRLGWMKKHLPLKLLVGLDALLQPSGEFIQLSPSIFLRARVKKTTTPIPDELVLCCPSCGFSPLEEQPQVINCPKCKRRYAVKKGIADFRMRD